VKTLWNWLPSTTDLRVRVFAWASLVSQILIIGTGGAVRLTGSGLGCPTWPRCTEDSFVSTPEMGWHGVIEFGNRLLTFVLVIIAVVMLVLLLRLRKERPELFRLSIALGLGIPGQAVIGGITVLTNLNPLDCGTPLPSVPGVGRISRRAAVSGANRKKHCSGVFPHRFGSSVQPCWGF